VFHRPGVGLAVGKQGAAIAPGEVLPPGGVVLRDCAILLCVVVGQHEVACAVLGGLAEIEGKRGHRCVVAGGAGHPPVHRFGQRAAGNEGLSASLERGNNEFRTGPLGRDIETAPVDSKIVSLFLKNRLILGSHLDCDQMLKYGSWVTSGTAGGRK